MRWCALVWPANKVCAGRTSTHCRLFNTRFNCFPQSLGPRSLNLTRLHDPRHKFVLAIRPTASLITWFNFSSTTPSDLFSNPQPFFTRAHPTPSFTNVISAPPLRLRERLKRKTHKASTASCLDVVAWVSFDTLSARGPLSSFPFDFRIWKCVWTRRFCGIYRRSRRSRVWPCELAGVA